MSITLSGLLIGVGIAAVLFTLVTYFIKKPKHLWMAFTQAYVGILFLFSGAVKAVDPLGTAYKMEQYFAEFESAFEASWMSFLAPLFPTLQSYSVSFSVVMIVFEIVLGLMILFGIYKKFASWAFFLLIVLFTFLTGFTYLTGYVGEGATFFNFASWGDYKASNMKVTDCGCFGDFLKLKPKTSFLKDVFLLIPGLMFLFFNKRMHTLMNNKTAFWTTIISTVLVTLYCFSNYIWDIPHTDFRPFKEGVDIQATKLKEQEIQAAVQVTGFLMQNKADNNRKMEVSMADYSKYADEWEVVEQIRTKPASEPTKISEFELFDMDGNDATYELLENKGKSIWIVAQKLKGKTERSTQTVIDTIEVKDEESEAIMQKIVSSEKQVVDFQADDSYMDAYTLSLLDFTKKAKDSGYKVFFMTAGVSAEEASDFIADTGIDAKVYVGDDILLKTIIRSNPGILIMDNATIKDKYHIRKLPSFDEISK